MYDTFAVDLLIQQEIRFDPVRDTAHCFACATSSCDVDVDAAV